jgi:predicted permease
MLLSAVPLGFSTNNLLVFDVTLPSVRYRTPADAEAALHQIEASIAALPGVRAVGRGKIVPVHSTGWNCAAYREGSNGHDAGATDTDIRSASPSYFNALGVPVLRGRTFTDADVAEGAPVVVITRELGRKLFGDADPLGKSITICMSSSKTGPVWREIVGVVGDIRAAGLTDPPRSQFYFPTTQWINRTMSFVVRGAVPVTSVVPSIRRAVAATDPLLALANLRTMDDALAARLALPRFITWLLTLLGAVGLVLATVGVYGVIAYFVSRRTRELGLRIALGATPSLVRRMVVRQGFVLAATGVLIGTAVSAAATRVIATLLYGVTAHDVLTYVGVALLLGVVALLASYLPARRATRIDPLTALRTD